jgi:DNA/RNA endonuclease G (NUC1)
VESLPKAGLWCKETRSRAVSGLRCADLIKVSVFTGLMFAADDEAYRGIQLPRQFWKVVVMVKESAALSATGYLLN